MTWLMALHFLGLALWFAGFLGAGWTLRLRASGRGEPALERRFLFLAAHPGMALALVAGGVMLVLNPAHYLGEGWMRVKLVLACAFIAATIAVTRERSRVDRGFNHRPRTVALWHRGGLLAAAAALLLAVFRPI